MKFLSALIAFTAFIGFTKALECYQGTYKEGTNKEDMTKLNCGPLEYCLIAHKHKDGESIHLCFAFEADLEQYGLAVFKDVEKDTCTDIEYEGETGTVCTCKNNLCNDSNKLKNNFIVMLIITIIFGFIS